MITEKIPFWCTEPIQDKYDHWIYRDILSYHKLGNGIGNKMDLNRILNHPQRFLFDSRFFKTDGSLKQLMHVAATLPDGKWKRSKAMDSVEDMFYLFKKLEDKNPVDTLKILESFGRYKIFLHDYAEYRNMSPGELYFYWNSYKADAEKHNDWKEWDAYVRKHKIILQEQAVAKSTWQNEYAMVNPVQVLDLTETEQKHLLYHFSAFSADVTRENVFGAEEYKYCTVLLPEEYVAYTHLPRVSEGGVFSIVQDVPKFSVPARMQGDIYMGTILNPERFTFEHGYRTAFDYRIDENNLMHGFFTGASRSGKTVAAMRFIAELSKIRRKKTGKRLRIVVMDPKQDWRTLARFVEPERFNFYSMGNPNFNPIHINPWKVPHGVNPQVWIDGVIDIYCRAYGLLERGKQMIADVVYELYKENGVFDVSGSDSESKDLVAELSSRVNFQSIYRRMEEKRDKLTGAGKSGNDTKDAYARLIERLSCFSREYSIESKLYGSSEGIAIDDLIGADEVTVLESKGLENTFKNFIFGVITSGFFKFALAHEGGYLADDQYETVLVLEEANEVLTGNDCAGTGGGQNFGMSGQSEFEQILDQSAGYGLFIFAITQKIADMPSSVIANSGLVFAGRLKRTDDINVVVRTVGREERIDDRDLVKWFPRSPTGWFVCQTSRTFDFKDAEPILVQISRLNINPPSNIELDEILIQKKAKTIMSA